MIKMDELLNRIVIDPKVMVGKPVIKGTRITVQNILNLAAQGISKEEILEDFPNIKEEDILACYAFASKTLEDSTYIPLSY